MSSNNCDFSQCTYRSQRISSFDLCSGVQCKKSTLAWPGVAIKNIIYVVLLMAFHALRSWVLRWGVGSLTRWISLASAVLSSPLFMILAIQLLDPKQARSELTGNAPNWLGFFTVILLFFVRFLLGKNLSALAYVPGIIITKGDDFTLIGSIFWLYSKHMKVNSQ